MLMTKSYKYILTFSLFFCYFAYGVNFYVVGPTLIELAALFQTTIEQICLIYTVRSAGYTFGSLSGFLFKYINRQLTFVFFLTLMGITLVLMPHVKTLTYLFVLAGINGFSIGSFDTAINVWVLEIWAEESGPFMQALHFTYGIGSFVAPLICEPFLSSESIHGSHGPPLASAPSSPSPSIIVPPFLSSTTPTPLSLASTITAKINDSFDTITSDKNGPINPIDPIEYLIYIPYSIAGAITVFAALIVLIMYYYKKYEPPTKEERRLHSKRSGHTQRSKDETMLENGLKPGKKSLRDRMPPFITVWLVVMGSLFLTFFVGMEQMHLQFLPTFAVNTELDISPSTAAMMSSAAAFAFTIGRCLSIPLAIKVKPVVILYTNHFLMLLGTILLAIYANNSEKMLWVGNVILGVGFSSVYASIYAFLEQQLSVTNRIGSVFVFAGGLTAALSPSVVGQYIEANPLILVWFNLACCLLCLVIFVIIHLTVHLKGKSKMQDLESSCDMDDLDNDDDSNQRKPSVQLIKDSTQLKLLNENNNPNNDLEENSQLATSSLASTSTTTSAASTSGIKPLHAATIVPYFDASDDDDDDQGQQQQNNQENDDKGFSEPA